MFLGMALPPKLRVTAHCPLLPEPSIAATTEFGMIIKLLPFRLVLKIKMAFKPITVCLFGKLRNVPSMML